MSTVSWTINAGQAAGRAYRMLGRGVDPFALTPDQWTQASLVMNGLLKGLETSGINVFRQTQIALTTTAGVQTVAIVPYVMGIEEARLVVTASPLYERPLGRFQYAQYMELPNKLAAGSPSIFMFDRQVSSTQLYLWPVSPTSVTINATVGRTANDIVNQTDSIDLPDEWLEGFTCMLAEELMDDEAMADMDANTAQRITQRAAYWKGRVEDFDRPTSVFIKPWGRKGSGRFWR